MLDRVYPVVEAVSNFIELVCNEDMNTYLETLSNGRFLDTF